MAKDLSYRDCKHLKYMLLAFVQHSLQRKAGTDHDNKEKFITIFIELFLF